MISSYSFCLSLAPSQNSLGNSMMNFRAARTWRKMSASLTPHPRRNKRCMFFPWVQSNICAATPCQAPPTPALHPQPPSSLPPYHNHTGYPFACLHLTPADSNASGEHLVSCYAAYSILQPQHRVCEWRTQAVQNSSVKGPHVHLKGCSSSPTRTLPKSRLLLTARALLLSLSTPPQENAVLWKNSSPEACRQLQRSPNKDHDSLYKQRHSNPLYNV